LRAVGLENRENGTGEIFDEKVEEAVVTKKIKQQNFILLLLLQNLNSKVGSSTHKDPMPEGFKK
jgi:hypothetical protein